MADTTGRTYWSKDHDEAPPYSDWEITFMKQNDNDEDTEQQDGQNDDDDKNSDGTNKNKRRKHNTSQAGNDSRISKTATAVATTTYHVHRNMIGPRSEYFTRLFCQPLLDGNAN